MSPELRSLSGFEVAPESSARDKSVRYLHPQKDRYILRENSRQLEVLPRVPESELSDRWVSMHNSLVAELLSNPRISARMFFDYREHRGLDNFRFRPRIRRQAGMHVINVSARDGTFAANVLLRPNASDLNTFAQIFLAASYNIRRLPRHDDIVALCRSFSRPLILDLGANIGLASLYFKSSWPTARVIAVEPHSGNVDILRRNAPEAAILHAGIASERCRNFNYQSGCPCMGI